MTDEIQRHHRAARFGIVDSSVIRDPQIGIAATAVYALLATYASAHGERAAYPSRETMAEALGCSTDTVDRALKVLREQGVLVTHRRQRKTALHFLHDMGAPRAIGAVDNPAQPVDNPQNLESANPGTQDPDSANPGSLTPQIPALDSAHSGGSSTSGVTPVSTPSLRSGGALPGLEIEEPVDDEPGTPVPSLVAQGITAAWWETFTPRPTANFVGQRKIVQRLLEAGWSPNAITAVLAGANPPITLAFMERSLREPRRPGGIVAPHDWQEGDTWLTR